VEGLDIRVYSMEELCYCLKENAFLLDLSIMNDKLVDWIGEECKVWELAKQLYPMVHKQGSLSVFVVTILQYVGMYDPEEILQVEQVLKQGAGLSNLEKRKSQIDYMVEKRKYAAATVNISAMEMVNAMEVSLTSVMVSLVTGGRTRFSTCGRMIFTKVCALL
jgi:hypothetical protein